MIRKSGTPNLSVSANLPVNPNLSPEPILAALESYRGTIVDLDHSLAVSSASLVKASQEISDQLIGRSLRPGDRVVTAVGNGPLFVATLTGILTAGGAPLLVHAATPPTELKRTAMRFGARFVLRDQWDAADANAANDEVQVIAGTEIWVRLFELEIDRNAPEFVNEYPVLPGVPLHPTSGTTGQPKVALRPGERAIAEAQHYVDTIGVDHSDTLLCVAPMSHAYAYGMCVMVPLLSGANVVTMRRFTPALVFGAFGQHDVTILPAVPAMLDVLMFGAGKRLLHATKTVLTAGSPLPARTDRAIPKGIRNYRATVIWDNGNRRNLGRRCDSLRVWYSGRQTHARCRDEHRDRQPNRRTGRWHRPTASSLLVDDGRLPRPRRYRYIADHRWLVRHW